MVTTDINELAMNAAGSISLVHSRNSNISGPDRQEKRQVQPVGMEEECIGTVVDDTSGMLRNPEEGGSTIDVHDSSDRRSLPVVMNEKHDEQYVRHWEQQALSHFRTSSWQGKAVP